MPGIFEFTSSVEGEQEVKHWLRSSNRQVDDFLYELVDAITFHAEDRLRAFAPGSIKRLVDVELAHAPNVGAIEGSAGVEPDITEENFGRGLGSDPADYPFYVEVGTGVHATEPDAPRTPIHTIPGSYPMAWEDPPGNFVFAWQTQGQEAQHYGRRAFEETVAWTPARIQLARDEFAAETEARSLA